MPVYYEWTSTKKSNRIKHDSPRFEVTTYPLKTNVLSIKESSSSSIIDHINKWSSGFEEVDPLLRFEQMNLEEDVNPLEVEKIEGVNYSKAWSTRRTGILSKYTTGEKLTIVSSYLPGGEKTLIRQVSNLNEKVKHRLEQLDDFDEGSVRKTMGLSQQEFVTKINLLNDEIKKAWESEQRVKAFKIGIQCSKLLSDISVMQFYPSKFILITDTLDTFGNLVFNRLKEKSFGNNNLINVHNIDPRAVPESAKETCQNWMYKMASIRELLPRLYMEMALLKCYVFISKDEIKPAIARITTMIRGIGNPLVAAYLRVYLCHNASKLLGKDSEEYFYANFKEFLDEYQQIFLTAMRKKYEVQLLTQDKYLNLFVPALDWLLFGTLNSNKCKTDLLDEFLLKCEQMENNELFLCCIVSAFDSPTIIKKAPKILEMVHSYADKMVLMNEVLTSLGEHLCKADNHRQMASESLIQTWWKVASSMKNTNHFLQVLEPWLQFACTHLSTQHVNVILRGTIRYMIKCGKPADEFSGNFQFVIKRMLKSVPDVEELFLMDAFMPLVELVQTSSARTMMAKTVLSIFFSRYNSVHIEDHIVISSLMRLCCILHDSINAVTVEDESKICGELINKFIQSVTYQDDLERQLNFYVECRSSFIKLDAVLITLVHAVNTLAARASPARGKWLQRACAAYCFVTVPSLHCTLTKTQLYLLSGQVALLNNCIGQAEANFKALIGLIPDIPDYILEDGQKKPTHVKVAGILSDFLSTLLLLPETSQPVETAKVGENAKQNTIDTAETFTSQYESAEDNSVLKLLKSSIDGKAILNSGQKNQGLLDQTLRSRLARLIATKELTDNPTGVVPGCILMKCAHEIAQIFPKESPTIYYIPYMSATSQQIKRNASGKLYDAVVNRRKDLRKRGVIAGSSRSSRSSSSETSSATEVTSLTFSSVHSEGELEVEEKLHWLRICVDPWHLVESNWEATTNVRLATLQSKSGTVEEYLNLYPALKLPEGYRLDNVDSNCKAYILSGFIKTMERIHWKKTEPLYYNTLLRILDLLCEMTQDNYMHHLESVLSNDELYGCDSEFIEVLNRYATNICQELLVVLKMLGDNRETKKQYHLALELFWRVVRRGDLTQRPMMSLAGNLWMLSQKTQDSNNKLAKAILTALQKESNPNIRILLQKLEEGAKNS